MKIPPGWDLPVELRIHIGTEAATSVNLKQTVTLYSFCIVSPKQSRVRENRSTSGSHLNMNGVPVVVGHRKLN